MHEADDLALRHSVIGRFPNECIPHAHRQVGVELFLFCLFPFFLFARVLFVIELARCGCFFLFFVRVGFIIGLARGGCFGQ